MSEKTPQQKLGHHTETLARKYLEARGLICIKRNFNCKLGEIDLIMRDKETLAFIEVRYRGQSRHATPLESISYYKQRKLTRTAQVFLKRHYQNTPPPCRFDAIAITSGQKEHKIIWIKDAFQMQ